MGSVTDSIGRFEMLEQRVEAERAARDKALEDSRREENRRSKNYSEALKIREARIAAGEGTPNEEIRSRRYISPADWQEEVDDFMDFARKKDFRGSSVIRWHEELVVPERSIGRRALDKFLGHDARPEPVVPKETRGYRIGVPGNLYGGRVSVYLCEDGAYRQVIGGGNPEPLDLITPFDSFNDGNYAGSAVEPRYDVGPTIPLQLEHIAKTHLID